MISISGNTELQGCVKYKGCVYVEVSISEFEAVERQ